MHSVCCFLPGPPPPRRAKNQAAEGKNEKAKDDDDKSLLTLAVSPKTIELYKEALTRGMMCVSPRRVSMIRMSLLLFSSK
jgi:hypothetical protein